MAAAHGFEMTPPTAQIFGNAAREHMERYGTTEAQLAAVGAKNHRHSANNPDAQFQDVYTVDEILAAKTIHRPLTKLQCSPTSDGAAAAVVVSERFVVQHGLHERAVEIVAQAMTTDTEESFASGSCIDVVGKPMSRAAGQQVFESSGLGIEDVDVIELHDCFSINELLTYEALGMCADGESGQARRMRGDDLRRPMGGQPLGRPDLQGPSARRDRSCPGGGTGTAAAGRGGSAAGDGRAGGARAQHRARRGGSGHPAAEVLGLQGFRLIHRIPDVRAAGRLRP